MNKLQKKRFDEIIKRHKRMKDWQKQLAEPIFEFCLDIRKKLGKDAFAKVFKKKDKLKLAIIEYVATGIKSDALIAPVKKAKAKKSEVSTEVFIPAKKKKGNAK